MRRIDCGDMIGVKMAYYYRTIGESGGKSTGPSFGMAFVVWAPLQIEGGVAVVGDEAEAFCRRGARGKCETPELNHCRAVITFVKYMCGICSIMSGREANSGDVGVEGES